MILTLIVFLQVPLRSFFADLPSRGNLTIIGAATCLHASREDSTQELTRSTRRQDPSRAKFLLLTLALGDIITTTSFADVTSQSADVIVDFDPGLTFSVQVLLTQFFVWISFLQSVFAYCVSKWIKRMFFFLAKSILCWRGVRITYLGLKLCAVFLRVACSGIIVLVHHCSCQGSQ